jgi:hypothetical protein
MSNAYHRAASKLLKVIGEIELVGVPIDAIGGGKKREETGSETELGLVNSLLLH